jgi:hypothetical protein
MIHEDNRQVVAVARKRVAARRFLMGAGVTVTGDEKTIALVELCKRERDRFKQKPAYQRHIDALRDMGFFGNARSEVISLRKQGALVR